jgi:hypothetical protein
MTLLARIRNGIDACQWHFYQSNLISINELHARACKTLVGSSLEGAAMTKRIDVVELAHELSKIASTTSDPATGRQLMEVVERILRAAGLPPPGS